MLRRRVGLRLCAIFVLTAVIVSACMNEKERNNLRSVAGGYSVGNKSNNVDASGTKGYGFDAFFENEGEIEYGCQAFFDSFDYIYSDKASLKYTKKKEFEDGTLYLVSIGKDLGDFLPKKRRNIGYFFVQSNKIVRLVENRDNPWNLKKKTIDSFIKNRKMPKYSQTVCRMEGLSGKAKGKTVKGWRNSLTENNGRIEFNSIFNTGNAKNKEPSFWEAFVWDKSVGLVEYRCGYKAGVDFVWLLRDGFESSAVV